MAVERVLLAEPRGFCAGVEMAIKALAWMVRSFPPPVYCYHEIVHNRVDRRALRAPGRRVRRRHRRRPAGPADHAVGPRLGARGRRRGAGAGAATSSTPSARSSPRCTTRCAAAPARATASSTSATRATRRRSARWPSRPSSISRVERVAEVAALPEFDEPVALLAQTTLSHRDWDGVAVAVRERFPDVWSPGRSDLCFATTNRQSALMALAERCDAVVVIGSANSSNTRALEKLAREAGCALVRRVNDADEIPDEILGARVVGVTAGASAPDELVEQVIDAPRTRRRRRGRHGHRRGRVLPAAAQAARAAGGHRVSGDGDARRLDERAPRMDDRALGASDVLSALAGC